MKKLIIGVACLLFSAHLFAQSNLDIFYEKNNPVFNIMGQYTYTVSSAAASKIAIKYKQTGYDFFSAVSMNTLGFRLYQQKAYNDAAEVFKRAIQLDSAYVYPHYNLACMLSLLTKQGPALDIEQIIYHLQYAALLDPKYAGKPKTDTDLDPVRGNSHFKEYLAQLENGKLIFSSGSLYIKNNTHSFFAAKPAAGEAGPIEIDSKPVFSNDKSSAVFYTEYKDKYQLCILKSSGFLIIVPSGFFTTIHEVALSDFASNQNGDSIVFVKEDGLYRYHAGAINAKRILALPCKDGSENIYEIMGTTFHSSSKIRFMGGSRFEYQFSGHEFEINLDGTGFRKVPGGRYIEPEDLRGGDY